MAVYTDVSFEDLEAFLKAYGIGEPKAFKGIAEGVENSNYYLKTEQGGFILTLYEKRVAAAEIPFFLSLMEYLAAGLKCPLPLAAQDGALYRTLNGRPAALLTFLDGISLRRPTPPHCREAGRALGTLHRTAQDFSGRRANALGPEGWQTLARATEDRSDEVMPGLRELIVSELAEVQSNWPQHLPEGIIHADLFPDNVLFLEDRVSGLIDFYFACHDRLAYDLAIMLNAWCFESDGAFNHTKATALIAGYQEVRLLEDQERRALPVLARGAALRFLLTRLYDWLNHDPQAMVRPKDPREFARRLRFHRGQTSAEAYGL